MSYDLDLDARGMAIPTHAVAYSFEPPFIDAPGTTVESDEFWNSFHANKFEGDPVYVISSQRQSIPFIGSLVAFLAFTSPAMPRMSLAVGSRGPVGRKRSWKQRGKKRGPGSW